MGQPVSQPVRVRTKRSASFSKKDHKDVTRIDKKFDKVRSELRIRRRNGLGVH